MTRMRTIVALFSRRVGGARRFWLLGSCLLVLVSQTARAGEPLRLAFSSASTCGTAADFAARLHLRHVELSPSGSALSVTASMLPRGAEATFELTTPEGVYRRRLIAESCDAALDAAAFAVELALPLGDPPPLVSEQEQPPPPSPEPPETHPVSFDGAAAVGATLANIGSLIRLEARGELTFNAGRVFAPSIRAGVLFQFPSFEASTIRGATFAACPLRAGTDAVTYRPCLRVELGGSSEPDRSVATTSLGRRRVEVLAVGPAASARWLLTGRLFLDVEVAGMLMRVNERYYGRADAYVGLGLNLY